MKLSSVLCFLLCFFFLIPAAQAVRMEDPDGLSISFDMKTLDEWTFVTPDNYLEHMDLLLSRGCTADAIHERFHAGHIQWEGYYTKLPEGCIRYEKWSDAYTRNVWSLESINAKARKALLTDVETLWSQGRYTFYKTFIKSTSYSKDNLHGICYSFNTNPPLGYESGLGRLVVQNGVAMAVSYVQFTSRASSTGYLKNDNTYSNMNRVRFYDSNPQYTNLVRQTPCADLLPDNTLVVNAHTGMPIPLTGLTEKDASVTLQAQGRDFSAQVASDGHFSAVLQLENQGTVDLIYTASKDKLQDHVYQDVITTDDSVSALILTKYPLGEIPFGQDVTVTGLTNADAAVYVQLDGGERIPVPVENGSFCWTGSAQPWILHELTVTVCEEGRSDCSVTLPFHVQYENTEQGIREFKKAASSLNCRQLAADPAGHTGELVRMEFFTTAMQHTGVGLAFEANGLYNNQKYPMILLSDGYINDMITDGMYITAYGIVSEPTLTDEPLPRIQLVYVTYQKKTYR